MTLPHCVVQAFVKARGDGIAFDLSKAGFTIAGTKRQLSATLHLDGVVQHGYVAMWHTGCC